MFTFYPLKDNYYLIFKLAVLPIIIVFSAISYYSTAYFFPQLHNVAENSTTAKGEVYVIIIVYFVLPFLITWVFNRFLYYCQPKSKLEISVHKNLKFKAFEKDFNIDNITRIDCFDSSYEIYVNCPNTFRNIKECNKRLNYIFLNGELVGALKENEHTRICVKEKDVILGVYTKRPERNSEVFRYNFIALNLEKVQDKYINIEGAGLWGPILKDIPAPKGFDIINETKFVILGSRR